jgi:hypothetical protein
MSDENIKVEPRNRVGRGYRFVEPSSTATATTEIVHFFNSSESS